MDLSSLEASLLGFLLSGVVIVEVGRRLTRVCDELADQTGLGEALMGAIFLGAITSLPGITASVTAAIEGSSRLALSNAYGGIAAQTLFIALADIAHRRANLEHAAASLENMLSASVLLVLLAFLLMARAVPGFEILHVHPVSIVMPVAYIFLMRMIGRTRRNPMWHAHVTQDTRLDTPEDTPPTSARPSLIVQWTQLGLLGLIIVAAGWLLTHTGHRISTLVGLDASIMGGILIAMVTSLPELVTAVAAVRRGALTLAVGGILGGNAFDTLFAVAADWAYLPGSIFLDATSREDGLAALAALMTGLILFGLLHRERKGPGGIGFESVAVITAYIVGMVMILSQD